MSSNGRSGKVLTDNWRKVISSDTLGVYDLDPGQEITLTIKHVEECDVPDPKSGKARPMPVVRFEQTPKGLVLNRTNAKRITDLAGTNKLGQWGGIRVTLHHEEDRLFGGGRGPTLRVKPGPRQARPRAAEGGGEVEA